MDEADALDALLTNIVVPLATIDQATVHVVTATPERVHLHLSGAYAGCSGNAFIERNLLAPLVREIFPRAVLDVTSFLPVPANARLLGAAPDEPRPTSLPDAASEELLDR